MITEQMIMDEARTYMKPAGKIKAEKPMTVSQMRIKLADTGVKYETGIITNVMKENGITHAKLAEMLGYKAISGVTGRLSSLRISNDKLVEMLNALGYEVVVRKNGVPDGENEVEWRIIG